MRNENSSFLVLWNRLFTPAFTSAAFIFLAAGSNSSFAAEPWWTNHVRTLQKPIRVYHYGQRKPHSSKVNHEEQMALFDASASPLKKNLANHSFGLITSGTEGSVNLKDPAAWDYLKAMTKNAQDGSGPDWLAGYGGVYAGADPAHSVDFMMSPGFLIELMIPVGAKYIDLISAKKERLSIDEISELRKVGVTFSVYQWVSPENVVYPSVLCRNEEGKPDPRTFHIFDAKAVKDLNVYSEHLESKPVDSGENAEKAYRVKRAEYARIAGYLLWSRYVDKQAEPSFRFLGSIRTSLGLKAFAKFMREIPSEAQLKAMAKRDFIGCGSSTSTFHSELRDFLRN